MKCSRCGRKLKDPVYIGGAPYGCVCAKRPGLWGMIAGVLPKFLSAVPVIVRFGSRMSDALRVTAGDISKHLERIGGPDDVEVECSYSPTDFDTGDESMAGRVAGTYDPSTKELVLYPPMAGASKVACLEVVSHEYGHAVWFQKLSEDERMFWREAYRRILESGGRFVTDYASTNPEEFFAESYMTYVHSPNALRLASKKCYGWLRDHVFDGREFHAGEDS